MSNLFELATRARLRFKVNNGVIATEDLWSLSLTALDKLACALNKELQDSAVSFIDSTANSKKADAQLSFDVVKHVIDIRLEELAVQKKVETSRRRRDALLDALADQEEASLRAKSAEDLRKELAELDKQIGTA